MPLGSIFKDLSNVSIALALVGAGGLMTLPSMPAQASDFTAQPSAAADAGLRARAAMPDGTLLAVTNAGELRLFAGAGGEGLLVGGVPVVVGGSRSGLFDIAPAPDFAQTGRVLLHYSEDAEAAAAHGVGTRNAVLVSARLVLGIDGTARLERHDVEHRADRFSQRNVRYGGEIAQGLNGELFVTLESGTVRPMGENSLTAI